MKTFAVIEGEIWVMVVNDVWRKRGLDQEDLYSMKESLARCWDVFEAAAMKWVTKGWWLYVKMEPRLRILKKQREPLLYMDGDGETETGQEQEPLTEVTKEIKVDQDTVESEL